LIDLIITGQWVIGTDPWPTWSIQTCWPIWPWPTDPLSSLPHGTNGWTKADVWWIW